MCAVHLNLHSFPTRRSSDLIPRMVRRVVWGLDEVMAIFWPTSAFVSVDLPALGRPIKQMKPARCSARSEEHTSELQSRGHLVCRLLLDKKKIQYISKNVMVQ